MREVFVVLYDGAAWRSAPFQTAAGQTLRDAVTVNALASNQRQQDNGRALFSTNPEEYDLYSWHLQPLPPAARVAQVPRPGVVIGVHRSAPERIGAPGEGTAAVAILLRRELEGDEEVARRFSDYLDSPAPRWPAVPLVARDVLVSYDATDDEVVVDLARHLAAAALTCQAVERPATTTGGEAWRAALASSAILVSVVGSSSVESVAVLREAGAAWAVGRAVVPALVGVPANRLHYLLSSYQARDVGTAEARASLATELSTYMAGPAAGMGD